MPNRGTHDILHTVTVSILAELLAALMFGFNCCRLLLVGAFDSGPNRSCDVWPQVCANNSFGVCVCVWLWTLWPVWSLYVSFPSVFSGQATFLNCDQWPLETLSLFPVAIPASLDGWSVCKTRTFYTLSGYFSKLTCLVHFQSCIFLWLLHDNWKTHAIYWF